MKCMLALSDTADILATITASFCSRKIDNRPRHRLTLGSHSVKARARLPLKLPLFVWDFWNLDLRILIVKTAEQLQGPH